MKIKKHSTSSCCVKDLSCQTIAYVLAGVSIGILITYPIVTSHPIRWALIILTISLACHLYPRYLKGKK